MRGYIYIAVAALLMLFPTLANRYSGYSGQYLVAFDMRQSDYFANAVVYVADNKVMGAMGYVLGKAYSADAIKDDPLIPQEIKDANIPVYEGGPLGRDSTLFILKHVISGKDEPAWQGYKVHVMTDEQKAAAVKDVIVATLATLSIFEIMINLLIWLKGSVLSRQFVMTKPSQFQKLTNYFCCQNLYQRYANP